MKKSIAALLLLAPLAVLAQGAELPPPPVPDGAAAGNSSPSSVSEPLDAPSPVAEKSLSPGYVPRYHSRDAWFIGFGVGTGGGTVYEGRSFAPFQDLTGPDPIVAALRFEVGLTLTDRLLLGVELFSVGTQQKVSGELARAAIVNADAVLTFFPDGDGLFLRLGGGVSLINHSRAGTDEYSRGLNALVGVGYAFWIGERFNLSIRFDHSRQRSLKGNGPENSEFWAGTIGFDWY
jgi:hypothetical protein